MSVVTVGYVLVGATLTLMVPYNTLNPAAAIPDAFAVHGAAWAKYVVSVGALCGMTTTLFGSLFSLPRCVYAMVVDGLVFSWLARVSDKTKVPIITLLLCGFFSALIALLFDIEKLVEFMSIGTLMAYTIVSASVIILRYQPASRCNITSPSHSQVTTPTSVGPPSPTTPTDDAMKSPSDTCSLLGRCSPREPSEDGFGDGGELRSSFRWLLTLVGKREPGVVAAYVVVIFTVFSAALCSLVQFGGDFLALPYPAVWAVFLCIFLVLALIFSVMVIVAHHQNQLVLSFRVPLVPLLPLTSIFFNVGLMMHLNPMTWLRFVIWMALGLLLYFTYGQHHSREGEPVTSCSTLLSEPAPAGNTVFGSMQQTLSQVTSKIASASTEGKKPVLDQEDNDNL